VVKWCVWEWLHSFCLACGEKNGKDYLETRDRNTLLNTAAIGSNERAGKELFFFGSTVV
jgi:hypothetical protein